MNWYVLQVLTGTERETADALQRLAIKALVPLENRTIHTRGAWTQRDYVLFPGYVFLCADYTAELHHQVTALSSVIRILSGGGAPIPLTEAEMARVLFLSENMREPSVVELFEDETRFRVVSGALLPLQDKIVKLDRHRRRAVVNLTLAGEPLRAAFSVTFQRASKTFGGCRVDSSPHSQKTVIATHKPPTDIARMAKHTQAPLKSL